MNHNGSLAKIVSHPLSHLQTAVSQIIIGQSALVTRVLVAQLANTRLRSLIATFLEGFDLLVQAVNGFISKGFVPPLQIITLTYLPVRPEAGHFGRTHLLQ